MIVGARERGRLDIIFRIDCLVTAMKNVEKMAKIQDFSGAFWNLVIRVFEVADSEFWHKKFKTQDGGFNALQGGLVTGIL